MEKKGTRRTLRRKKSSFIASTVGESVATLESCDSMARLTRKALVSLEFRKKREEVNEPVEARYGFVPPAQSSLILRLFTLRRPSSLEQLRMTLQPQTNPADVEILGLQPRRDL